MIENAPFENLFEIFDADARNNIIETMFRDRINLIEQLTFPNLLKEVYFLPSFDYKRSFIRDILVSLKGEN